MISSERDLVSLLAKARWHFVATSIEHVSISLEFIAQIGDLAGRMVRDLTKSSKNRKIFITAGEKKKKMETRLRLRLC